MRIASAYTLYKREMLEVVRDRRTLFLMVVFPLLLYPGLFLVASQIAMESAHDVESELALVAVTPDVPPPLISRVGLSQKVAYDVVDGLEEGLAALKARNVAAVVVLPAEFERRGEGLETSVVEIHFDATREVSERVQRQLTEALEAIDAEMLSGRLELRRLPASFANPVTIRAENVAPPEAVGGHLFGRIAPLLIIMMIAMGAFYPAIEVTVGEKERGTLQTLLTAPIAALEIVTGKFLAVFTVSAIAGAANVASMSLLVGMAAFMPGDVASAISLHIAPLNGLFILVTTALVGLLFSAVMMTIATFAKSSKEAQAWMTPVYLLGILPTLVVQMPGITLEGSFQLVPVLNHALLLRELIEGKLVFGNVFAVVVSSLIYTAASLILAARIFEHESTVLGDGGWFRRTGARRVLPVPSAGDAMGFLAVVFVFLFYGGSALQAWNLRAGVAVTQWGLILLPSLLFLRRYGADLRASLGLYRPPWRSMLAAVAIGVTAWYPVLWLSAASAPSADDPSRRMVEEMFRALLGTEVSLVVALFVVAVSPAVCEEVLFRGVLLRSFLRRFHPRTAILLTALLFGVFHMSLERVLPTAGLGVVLGVLAWRSGSLLPGVVFHALHNGLSVLLARYEVEIPGISIAGAPVAWQVALVAFGLGLGMWALVTEKAPAEDGASAGGQSRP